MTPQQSNGHPAQLSGQYAMTTLLQLQQHVDGQSVHGGEKEVGQRMHHECITRPCSPFQSIEYTGQLYLENVQRINKRMSEYTE